MIEQKREPRKQCSICKDYKVLSDFFKEKKKKLGVQSRCKICHTIGAKNWRRKNKEEPDGKTEFEKMAEAF